MFDVPHQNKKHSAWRSQLLSREVHDASFYQPGHQGYEVTSVIMIPINSDDGR